MLLHTDNDVVCYLDFNEGIPDLRHFAEQTACGCHLVAGCQICHHFLMFFLALLLGPDQQEVEHHKNKHEQQQADEDFGAAD